MISGVLSRVEITSLLKFVWGSSELVLMWEEHVTLTYPVLM